MSTCPDIDELLAFAHTQSSEHPAPARPKGTVYGEPIARDPRDPRDECAKVADHARGCAACAAVVALAPRPHATLAPVERDGAPKGCAEAEAKIGALAGGTIGAADLAGLAEHLAGCAACVEVSRRLAAGAADVDDVPEPGFGAAAAASPASAVAHEALRGGYATMPGGEPADASRPSKTLDGEPPPPATSLSPAQLRAAAKAAKAARRGHAPRVGVGLVPPRAWRVVWALELLAVAAVAALVTRTLVARGTADAAADAAADARPTSPVAAETAPLAATSAPVVTAIEPSPPALPIPPAWIPPTPPAPPAAKPNRVPSPLPPAPSPTPAPTPSIVIPPFPTSWSQLPGATGSTPPPMVIPKPVR